MSLASTLSGRLVNSRPQLASGSSSKVQQRTPAARLSVLAQQITQPDRAANGASTNGAAAAPAAVNGSTPTPQVLTSASVEKPAKAAQPQAADTSRINLIPHSRWPDGIPAVMGAHLMASGAVAPVSTSKGPGEGIDHLFFYPDSEHDKYVINQYVNSESGGKGLAEIVKDIADAAIKAKGSFTLVLSGGSLLKALVNLVDLPGVDFSKWHVAYADERNVPYSSEDSTHRGAVDVFLSKTKIPQDQIHAIKEGLPVKEAAREYEGQLLRIPQQVLPRNSQGWPVFDLILLGIGPDGHVASLFPNHKQMAAKEGWVLPVSDSPKPPPERITLSLPVINSAANAAVVAFGKGKAEIVQRALEVQCLPGALPAQLVRPSNGTLRWLLDCGAASQLNISKWANTKDFPRSQ